MTTIEIDVEEGIVYYYCCPGNDDGNGLASRAYRSQWVVTILPADDSLKYLQPISILL